MKKNTLSKLLIASLSIGLFILPSISFGADEFFGKDLKEYFSNFYIWSIGIAGMLAIIMLIYAGYLYVTSAGNQEQVGQAKEIIIGAIAGLLLLIIAGLVLKSLGVS